MNAVRPQALGSAYFLAFVFFAFAMVLWLRGLGRLLLPAGLIALVGYGVYRFVQKVREPLDD